MSKIRSSNTAPEIAVRKLLYRMGYRYRLHRKDLPGKPDLVFPGRRKVIFIHGCFWHMHSDPGCKIARIPKSRTDYWKPKLEANKERDEKNQRRLSEMGWQVLVIWECEIKNLDTLSEKIRYFLEAQEGQSQQAGWHTPMPAAC